MSWMTWSLPLIQEITEEIRCEDGVPLQDSRWSEHELERVLACQSGCRRYDHKKVIPLYLEAYSQGRRRFYQREWTSSSK